MSTPLDYDPRDVIATFNGEDIFGFLAGTFIKASRRVDAFTLTIGAQGNGARVASADRSGTVSFTLQQISPSNATMSKYAAKDAKNGTGKGELQIKDKNSDTLIHAQTAWIKKVTDVEFADGLTGREWMLETDDLEMNVAGSNAK